MVTLYGIGNCDKVRQARRWLEARALAYRFHDYRQQALAPSVLTRWIDTLGWEALVNRRSTTWRQLPEVERTGLSRDKAEQLLRQHPTLIKRPLLEMDNQLLVVGFDEAAYRRGFNL